MFDMTSKPEPTECKLPVGKNLSTLKEIARRSGRHPDEEVLETFALALIRKAEDWQKQGFAPKDADPLNHILKRISACPKDLWPDASNFRS